MSRNDPRMQRGIAVARRLRGDASLDRGMSELAWLRSRLSDGDLQAIMLADARAGLAGVRRVLADAGLSEAGFAALDAQYRRGGMQAVGAAVQAQMHAEARAATEQEVTTALEALRPEQWAAAERILAAGGPQRLAQEAMALGLSPEAATAAASRLVANGVQQTRQEVSSRREAVERLSAAHVAAERELAASSKDAAWDQLAQSGVAQAALDFYATHATALESAGVGAEQGEGPVAWMRRISRSGDDVAAKVAQATGSDPRVMRTILDNTRHYDDHREVRSSILASDQAERKARARKPQYPTEETPPKKPDGLDEALRKAVALEAPDQQAPVRAESVMDAAIAEAAGEDFKLTTTGRKASARFVERKWAPKTGLDAALERAAAHLESRDESGGGSGGSDQPASPLSSASNHTSGGSDHVE